LSAIIRLVMGFKSEYGCMNRPMHRRDAFNCNISGPKAAVDRQDNR